MIVYLLIACFFFIGTAVNVWLTPSMRRAHAPSDSPLVSVLIPMRNEERNVDELLQSVQGLTYPNLEILVLNDQSTDRTGEKLEMHMKDDQRIRVMNGKQLPDGWVGKVHACHQLSSAANGEYLLFIDADVRLKSDTVEKVLGLSREKGAGLVTGFPQFPVRTFLEKLLVPMQHFVVYTHLPILIANKTTWPAATAAHGAFMFFEKGAYEKIGGHTSVQHSLVEDVHIARSMKQRGIPVLLANVTSHVTCYMYETNKEVWSGFAKNIYTGLGRSPVAVSIVALFYAVLYIGSFGLFFVGLFWHQWLYVLPFIVTLLQRFLIDRSTRQRPFLFLTMPAAACALIAMMIYSMTMSLQKKGYEWKGRRYQ
ncbi:glycosyltransferase [Priestia koreensis]|uniref:glycosyltransferase n=1 Tax=Priestia koreensis TaxID=284581 RepID=UPI001F5A1E82|nr:glycosyltransferase family 2 protein [Priestia koreensis]UNL87071.1 glycosyltransferase [Priestia koreensis]